MMSSLAGDIFVADSLRQKASSVQRSSGLAFESFWDLRKAPVTKPQPIPENNFRTDFFGVTCRIL